MKLKKGVAEKKRWEVAPAISTKLKDQFPEINPVILQLLINRGLTTQRQIDEFLKPEWARDLHDPFLFRDMERALKRVLASFEKKEKVVVHGDYDADGITSAALVFLTLKRLGIEPGIFLPHREKEGYGLSQTTVEKLAQEKTNLIITTDCGTTNVAEIAYAKEQGIDVIVLDHHHSHEELPQTYALINPYTSGEGYPFRDLAAVGVAYKFAQALLLRANISDADAFSKWLLDLVAIGSVADYVKLIGENRTLVQYGLVVLKKTKRSGLRALTSMMGADPAHLDTWSISFQIAPRLNAASRMDHASTAFKLLVTSDEQEAHDLAASLERSNQERQRQTEIIMQEARSQVEAQKEIPPLLFVIGRDWATGLLGLVSSKLTSEYSRPSIVASIHKDEISASGRSIPAFNIIAALDEISELFTRYGGHEQACGFNLKNEKRKELKTIAERLLERAQRTLRPCDLEPKIDIDIAVDLVDIDWALFEQLESFEPTGIGNPRPRFLSRDLEVIEWQRVGAASQHLRLVLKDRTPVVRKMIAFGFGDWAQKLNISSKVDVVFEIGVNEWNGNRELQLKIVDLQLSKN